MKTLRIRVAAEDGGQRLDRFLAVRLPRSRSQLQSDIGAGRVRVDGETARASTRLAGGELVTVEPGPALTGEEMLPEAEPLVVLWEDADVALIDKPAGIAVHPGAGRATGTLAHRLLARYPEIAAIGHPRRPGIVHRLDLGTSGVMAIARSEASYQRLVADFAARRVVKEYLAVAHGATPARLTLEAPIARHPTERKRMAVRAGGRPARTELIRLGLAASDRLSLVALHLHTGRTHQIRVHLKHAGHPLVGDPTYGEERWKELSGRARAAVRAFPRPALHAWRLGLRHPRTGEPLAAEAPPPADLVTLWQEAGGRALQLCLAAAQSSSSSAV
ncbi:MAG TPA: RluA family pseudouridine synthase [Thermoanaerobaculia bacterium]|nr:RluA family pseudouridine synthase [Thermoanaerobaculia bacterium]